MELVVTHCDIRSQIGWQENHMPEVCEGWSNRKTYVNLEDFPFSHFMQYVSAPRLSEISQYLASGSEC